MCFSFLKVTGPISVCLETYKRIKWKFSCCYEETDTSFFFLKTLADHGKITKILLIFIVNPGFPFTKPTFYRYLEIVGIPNTVSFFIKIPKYRSKKNQIPNTEKPYDPHLLVSYLIIGLKGVTKKNIQMERRYSFIHQREVVF